MGVWVEMATWDDVPHLSQEAKDDAWSQWPEHEREARSKGIPILGSGNIYQKRESELVVADFTIPEGWPRAFAMDVGWKWTAALWFTVSPKEKIYYIYAEYKAGRKEPYQHAEAIKEVDGAWLPGVIDPAANHPSQKDGRQLLSAYRSLGLQLRKASNSLDGGITKCKNMLNADAIKVFRSCQEFLKEYRKYRRDLKGNVVKKDDHLVDCLRYFVLSGLPLLELVEHDPDEERQMEQYSQSIRKAYHEGAWMV